MFTASRLVNGTAVNIFPRPFGSKRILKARLRPLIIRVDGAGDVSENFQLASRSNRVFGTPTTPTDFSRERNLRSPMDAIFRCHAARRCANEAFVTVEFFLRERNFVYRETRSRDARRREPFANTVARCIGN